jgi:hypothetical protein
VVASWRLTVHPDIGDLDGFPISDAGVSDAWPVVDGLYLAGDGNIALYDAIARNVSQTWNPSDSGKVEMRAIIQGIPLAQIGDKASYGDVVIDAEAGPVLETSFDGTRIWTVRSDGLRMYLKGYTPDSKGRVSNPVCFFRAPAGGAITNVTDARALPNGAIILATDAGQKVYNPTARSWYEGSDAFSEAQSIYALGDYVLFTRGNPLFDNLELAIIPSSSINIPDSCSLDSVTVSQSVNWLLVRSYAANEKTAQAAWIEPDGSVISWQSGSKSVVLNAPGEQPSSASLRRVYDFSDLGYLFFATDSQIYRYTLDTRTWTLIDLKERGATWRWIDLVRDGNDGVLIAADTSGTYYRGLLNIAQTSVSMNQLLTPPDTGFGKSADDVLDVQDRDGTDQIWTFVTPDRIKYLNAANRSWSESSTFDAGNDKQFLDADGRGVVVGNGGETWWIAKELSSTPKTFARYDVESTDDSVALDATGADMAIDAQWSGS